MKRALCIALVSLLAQPAYANCLRDPNTEQVYCPGGVMPLQFRPTPNVGTVYDPYRTRARQTVCESQQLPGGFIETRCHQE